MTTSLKKIIAGIIAITSIMTCTVNARLGVYAESMNYQNVQQLSATTDNITISGNSNIPNLRVGKTASVTGILSSKNSLITSVTVGVYNNSGKLMTGLTVSPNVKSYNLKNLDKYVSFNILPEGSYHYMIKATNSSNNNATILDQTFTVSSGLVNTTDTITISGNSKISDLKQGKTASVNGFLTSSNSLLTSVTVGIYDNSGKLIIGKTVNPNSTTYNLSNVDRYITFNMLSVGSYHYMIKATNSTNNNLTVVDQVFNVSNNSGSNTTTDTITVTGNSKIPDLQKGKTASVTGVLTSKNSLITSIKIGIYDNLGNLIVGKTINPNSMTYNLGNLDRFITFNTLSTGEYHYKVEATNSSNSNVTIIDQTFTVSDGSNNNNTTTDTITISGNSTIPNLKQGKTASVNGFLTSKKSNITSVTVGIYDNSGKLIVGKTVNPNTTVYNLKNVDKYITFNTLSMGDYHYIVKATNSSNSSVTVVDQTFNVSNNSGSNTTTDTITVTGNSKIPNLQKGKTASVNGFLTSSKSLLTNVMVGIYDSSGKLVISRTVNPNSTTYNLNNIDRYITFNMLPVGNYHYIVKATNSSNKDLEVINQTFTVSNSSTSNDVIAISGNSKIPDLKKGKTASVTGTLTSSNSILTSVTVGIYDNSGKLISGLTVSPSVKTYNLRNLDRYVYFNRVPVGSYHYIVRATNSANNNLTVVDQTFNIY